MIFKKEKKEPTVKLYTLHWVEDLDRYTMTVDKIPESRLPDRAVHLTGEKGSYLLDLTGYTRPKFNPEQPKASAVDLNLYLLNNDINDALALNWKSGLGDIDWKKWIIIGIVATIGCGCMLAFWPY